MRRRALTPCPPAGCSCPAVRLGFSTLGLPAAAEHSALAAPALTHACRGTAHACVLPSRRSFAALLRAPCTAAAAVHIVVATEKHAMQCANALTRKMLHHNRVQGGCGGCCHQMTCYVSPLSHSCPGWAPPGGRGLLSLVEREYGSDGGLMEVHLQNPKSGKLKHMSRLPLRLPKSISQAVISQANAGVELPG